MALAVTGAEALYADMGHFGRTPIVVAWLGLVLIVCYMVDRKLYAQAGLGVWLKLRFRLSAVAALSCFIGAGAL